MEAKRVEICPISSFSHLRHSCSTAVKILFLSFLLTDEFQIFQTTSVIAAPALPPPKTPSPIFIITYL
jgi:hypothetical protein